ncbi:hypothetical protein IWZ00DRAFT_504684, partial [Phyllosticta capitalensis]
MLGFHSLSGISLAVFGPVDQSFADHGERICQEHSAPLLDLGVRKDFKAFSIAELDDLVLVLRSPSLGEDGAGHLVALSNDVQDILEEARAKHLTVVWVEVVANVEEVLENLVAFVGIPLTQEVSVLADLMMVCELVADDGWIGRCRDRARREAAALS